MKIVLLDALKLADLNFHHFLIIGESIHYFLCFIEYFSQLQLLLPQLVVFLVGLNLFDYCIDIFNALLHLLLLMRVLLPAQAEEQVPIFSAQLVQVTLVACVSETIHVASNKL